jgi:hypothetical protein
MSELEEWLNTVVCEKPWTVSDSIDFRQLIKQRAGVKGCEVYFTDGREGQKVHVRVDAGGNRISRTYDVR